MLELRISPDELEGLAAHLKATEKIAKAALNSTLVKMSAWIKTRASKQLAESLQISRRVVNRRTRSKKGRAWFGLNAISLIFLNAKQTKRNGGGVSASGGRFAKGAFIAKPDNHEHPLVFERRGAKRRMKRGRYAGKMRQPIYKVMAEIEEKSRETLEAHYFANDFEIQFFEVFERELKWRMQTSM